MWWLSCSPASLAFVGHGWRDKRGKNSIVGGGTMKDDTRKRAKNERSRILLGLTTVYALLYILFMATRQYGTAGAEPTVVKILFALFLVGYIAVWMNEGLGGAIFVVWWIGMWYLGLFVAQSDRGAAVVMGLPLFVLAVLFISAWLKKRKAAPIDPLTQKSITGRDEGE
jgi:hypothetical protein